ncbi:MAG: IS1380 family transposase [Burkholderiales bacterium]|nr:IS1380 family transposase [Burkholderiales bacterium]
MPDCTAKRIAFERLARRRVEVDFDGGDVSSDGGLLLLRRLEHRLGLLDAVAGVLADARDPQRIEHTLKDMLRQRVFGLVQGYEDLNDHARLRNDVLMQTACERDRPLASAPTLCRLENRASRAAAWAIHEVIIEKFIASFKTPPRELVLDFDATDDPLYGRQEGRFFHGYYDRYCYLPLYVFCGERLLVAYLRPSNIDESRHAGAVLKLLVARLRQAWPEVRILLRADSGFCRRRILAWCERNGVGYVVGLAKNRRLNRMTEVQRERLARQFAQSQAKQREFAELRYAARTWKTERRVIARLEHMDKGDNPRYLVTNLQGDARSVYEDLYCARGEMENRIKEAQLGLFADRTSCQRLLANQFRLLLSALAYILTERLRALALAGTEFARLQASTLRAKLLKIGAVILRNTRRVRVMLSSAFPYQAVYLAAARALDSS